VATREIIYIQLLNEGTFCVRPTLGEKMDEDIYRILPTDDYDPEDEVWEFLPGAVVRVENKKVSTGEVLIAIEKVSKDN
jgi:hypothetical protein